MKTKSKNMKVLVVLGALVIALSLILSACGPSNEEVIRGKLIEEFDQIKAGSGEDYDMMLESLEQEGNLEEIGIDSEEFLRALLEGFDYSINEITVEKSTATVKITVTRKSISDANKIFENKTEEYTAELEALAAEDPGSVPGMDEILAKSSALYMEAIAETSLSDMVCEIAYEKISNVWTPTEESSNAFAETIFQ